MIQVKELALFNPAVTYLVAVALCYSRIKEIVSFVIDWQRQWTRPKKKTVSWRDDVKPSKGQQAASTPRKRGADLPSISCPYDYILDIYGRKSFDKFVNYLDPNLRTSDPVQYELALELMDAVHGGAILVDDVADGSTMRKGRKAAHLIYGASETINRAYLRIFEVLSKIAAQKPALLPLVMKDITEIHEGQDISLVWRRDGLPESYNRLNAIQAYRDCSSLKTGALFRLLGHLVYGNADKDKLMSQVGWYCHLQNDCKNVFSSDVIHAKGAMAEDLRNGEYSFPIILGLFGTGHIRHSIRAAMDSSKLPATSRDKVLLEGVAALQAPGVRDACLSELEVLKSALADFSVLWGRQEKMTVSVSVKEVKVESA